MNTEYWTRYRTIRRVWRTDNASVEIEANIGRALWEQGRAKKPRLYVYGDKFDVIEDLTNRCRRPHGLYRQEVRDLFEQLNVPIDIEGMRWNQNAGCSMCPCSPGFVLPEQTLTMVCDTFDRDSNGHTFRVKQGIDTFRGSFTVWVHVQNLETVDHSKPARVLAGVI